MIINHNLPAMYAERQFQINSSRMDRGMQRLSSGLRINRGLDDPAGLAVSEKMRSQIRGLQVASRNAQDGVSFLQTAEGWLGETTEILQRMRELAVQSANGLYSREDRQQVQTEIQQLVDEVDRISTQAEYNGVLLLKGGFRNPEANAEQSAEPASENTAMRRVNPIESGQITHHELVNEGGGVALHIGANVDQRERVYVENVSATALGLAENEGEPRTLKVDYTTQEGANQAIGKIDSALFYVNRQRADLGAYQLRMEMSSRGIDVAAENLQAAESRIRDADMAEEMVDYVRARILTESSASILAQANMKPWLVVRMLDGASPF